MKKPEDRNCPFYGRHFVLLGRPFTLVTQHGNECALIATSYSPCLMETESRPIEWSKCPVFGTVCADLQRRMETE